MNYQMFRSKAQSGDVILVEGRSFVSRMIRAATGQNISHVALCVWIGDNLFLAEMREFRAFQFSRASDRLQNDMKGCTIYHGEAPDDVRIWARDFPEFSEAVFSARNRKYGYFQLLPVLWAQFRDKQLSDSNLVCSTYAQTVWQKSGWSWPTMMDPGDYFRASASVRALSLSEFYE